MSCPFSGILESNPNSGESKLDNNGTGGCPFIPEEFRKDPPISGFQRGPSIPFLNEFLEMFNENVSKDSVSLKKYSFPLKRTLYLREDILISIRKKEPTERIHFFEEFKLAGNKKFHENNFDEAIYLYTCAYSCYRWLEFTESENIEKRASNKSQEEQKLNYEKEDFDSMSPQLSEKSEKSIPQNIPKELQHLFNSKKIDAKSEHPFLKKIHKSSLVIKEDEIYEPFEKDTRNSLLISILLNISCALMKIKAFDQAILCIEESLELSENTFSLSNFRFAQAVYYNECSSIKAQQKALLCIHKAIESKKIEKLFTSSSDLIKRVMNLENIDFEFEELRRKLDLSLANAKECRYYRIKSKFKMISDMLQKAKEINFVDSALNKDSASSSVPITKKNFQVEILEESELILKERISIGKALANLDGVQKYMEEMEYVLKALNEIEFYSNLKFDNLNDDELQSALKDLKFNLFN